MERKCWCGAVIDEDRYEAGFTTCILHGSQRPHIGFTVYPHKTGGETVIIADTSRNSENVRLAKRAYARSR